jgi:hypothetical protein
MVATLAIILSGLPLPAGAGGTGPRTPDSDNDPASATAMSSGTAYPGNLSSSDDSLDYYSAQAVSGGQVFNVSVQVVSYPAIKVRLVAYDAAMVQIDESNLGAQWESMSFQPVKLNAKYYFVVVLSSGTGGDYSMQFSLETPKSIPWSGSDGGNLARASDNPADWYTFTLGSGDPNDVANFTIYHDPAVTIDAWIFGLWPDYISLTCNISLNHATGKTIAIAASNPGAYYLKIWSSAGSGAYTVIMAAQQQQPGDNDYDADHAHRLTSAPATGWVDSAWDHYAYYYLYLAQGETLTVKMTLTQNVPGKFLLYLYHRVSGAYYQDTNASNFQPGTGWTNIVNLTWTAQASNLYYVIPMADEAHSANGSATSGAANASFTLKVESPSPLNHAPVVVNQPPNQISEDSADVPWCQLYPPGVFDEMDGEGIYFSVINSTNIKLRLDLSPPSVYVTTTPNWSGTEKVTITATDTGGMSTVLEVNLQVNQLPDGPVVLQKLANLAVEEDSMLNFSLSEYFYDPDAPYTLDTLSYQWSMVPAGPAIPMFIDNTSGMMTIGPVTNINHQAGFLTTRQVNLRLRDHGDPVHYMNTQFFLVINHVNHAPFLPGAPVLYMSMMEDELNNSVNIKPYFADNDIIYAGDALRYRATGSEHVNCTILPDGRLEAKAAKDWYGEEVVYVTVTDLLNETATLEVTVTVLPVPDPPEIVSWWPVVQDEVKMNETETLNLTIEVMDPDTNVSLLTYKWWVDGTVQFGATGPRFAFVTNIDSAGIHNIIGNVSDGEFNDVFHSWVISVRNKNQLPVINITSPLEAGIYPEGQLIRFSAKATDADGDKLSYTWKEGNTTLGNTFSLNWKFPPGNHVATIWVDDGTDRAQASVTFFSDSVPNITIMSPEYSQHFKTSDNIKFSANVFDRDGDTVTLEWRDRSKGGRVLSRDANFTMKLGKGGHDIVLNATDGRNFVESPVLIIVDETPPKNPIPGFTAISVAAAILAAAALASLFFIRRRRDRTG